MHDVENYVSNRPSTARSSSAPSATTTPPLASEEASDCNGNASHVEDNGRLHALYETGLLDTPPDQSFDRLTALAARLLKVPVVLVSLVDKDRQFFKSQVGLPEPWASMRQTPLTHSLCKYVLPSKALVVRDARTEKRFQDNPSIKDLNVVAYLGVPIKSNSGHALGSFCAIDHVPRQWAEEEIRLLEQIAASVQTEIELHILLRKLRDYASFQKSIMESLAEGLCTVDETGRLTYMNSAGEQILGCSVGQVLGKDFFEVLRFRNEDDRPLPRDDSPISKTLTTGRAFRGDLRLDAARDETATTSISFSSASLVSLGKVIGAVFSFRDNSVEKRSVALLAGQEKIFELIVSSASMQSVLDSLIQLIESLAPGMKCSVLLFEPSTRTLHYGSAPSLPLEYSEALEGVRIGPSVGSCGTAAHIKERVIVSDIMNDPRWADYKHLAHRHGLQACWSQPIMTAHKDVIGTFAMYYSNPRMPSTWELELIERAAHIAGIAIERHKADESLREAKRAADAANEAKSRFLANMSHEIRTPLTAILGFSELMQTVDASDDDKKLWGEKIRSNGSHLLRLIDEILDLSKIEAGYFNIEKEEFDVRQLVHDVKTLMTPQIKHKGVMLRFEIKGKVPQKIFSDYSRLRQILVNLIGNAIKFTQDGEVAIMIEMAQSPARQLIFEIRDTGPGLDAGQAKVLFQPFVQADNSYTRKFGGSGLGLALSRKLARLLGGDVVLAASSPGNGSTFRVSLDPGEIECRAWIDSLSIDASKPVPVSTAFENPSILKDRHILLVEDAIDNQILIRRILEKYGARIDVASNGAKGVIMGLQGQYDIVLMDIQMPVQDGLSATRELRARSYGQPIIALTAHAMKENVESCLANGFNDYLSKPIDKTLLLRTVAKHLAVCTSHPAS